MGIYDEQVIDSISCTNHASHPVLLLIRFIPPATFRYRCFQIFRRWLFTQYHQTVVSLAWEDKPSLCLSTKR